MDESAERGCARCLSCRPEGHNRAVASEEHIRATLRSVWQLAAETCIERGDSSESYWSVTIDDGRYTVRIVPDSKRHELVASLIAAETLAGSGITVGRPVRTKDGALTATTAFGDVAVVHDVPGRPLVATDPLDQQWWGDLLGRTHRVLLGHQGAVAARLVLPDLTGAHLAVAAWLRPSLSGVAAAVTKLMVTDQLTYGVLHGDPRADLFRIDPDTGGTGLTGWGVPRVGPLSYDVAGAVRHIGATSTEDFLDGYASAGPVTRDEIGVALPVMLRLRWAHVAEAHARVLATTGSIVPLPRADAIAVAARRDRLEEARAALADLADADRAE